MKKNHYLPMTLIAIAVISGCSTAPMNASLLEAHNNYNNARNSAEITSQAPLELQDASVTLKKADEAFDDEDGDQMIDHLAYVATQQVQIARETAKRKTAELAVASSEAKRDKVRLDARTSEADSAKRQVADDQTVIAQQAIMINDLNAKKTERGFMITLGDVLFRTNKAQLEPGGMRNVEKLSSFLNQYPNYKVLIEGYTDSTGRHEYNQELSERRADSVRRALVDMGVSGDRIQAEGYADDYPVASNATASNRQLNRRVEIVLSDSNGNIPPR